MSRRRPSVRQPRAESSSPAGRTGARAVAGIVPLWFALYTGQAFEDFFIALRHSVLLVEGHGLTYEAGQRIQGFSSPLAVLLGAAAYAWTGADSAWSALWLLRALGIAAFCATAFCMIQSFLLGRRETRSPWPWILLLGLFVIAFLRLGMLGMATGTPAEMLEARIWTFVYFAYFGLLWLLSKGEKTKPLPDRVTS